MFKIVCHIDGYLYFYLANIENYTADSYTAQFTTLYSNDVEVNIKSKTVRLTGDYKAPYEKVHVQSLFKMFNNHTVYLKLIFT